LNATSQLGTGKTVGMDVRYINPFVEAVNAVFTTMLNLDPKRKTLKVSPAEAPGPQVTSIIGISGRMHGVVALRFPPPTALAVAARLLGSTPTSVTPEVIDAVAELVNMVAGNAKAKFAQDPPLDLGLPTVVEGHGYRLRYPSGSFWLEVPFSTDVGEFSIEVTYCAD
jgi:chemotaxis protein CheX